MSNGRRWLGLVVAFVAVGCSGRGAILETELRISEGDADKVLREVEAKLRENPKDGDALAIFARAAARLGHDADAIDALDRGEALGKDARRRSREAREELWSVVLEPGVAALDDLGAARPADVARARTAYARAALYDSTRAGTVAIGVLLDADTLRDSDRASMLDRAIDAVEKHPQDLRWVLGALAATADDHAANGRPADAVDVMKRAHELAPDDNEVTYDLGVHWHRVGEATGDRGAFESARDLFRTVTDALPDDAEARYNLALACYRLNAVECAATELDSLFQVRLAHGSGHALAARLALAAADTSRARGHITAARSLRGASVPVPESALLVRAGPPAAKRYVLVGPPTAIRRYTESSGREVEVWFDVPRGAVLAYSDRRQVASLVLADVAS